MNDLKIACRETMPKYKSHKIVQALKIKEVEIQRGGVVRLRFTDEKFQVLKPSGMFIDKHQPHPGGYYILYEDGYESYSPADAFEAGYKPLIKLDSEWERLLGAVNLFADQMKERLIQKADLGWRGWDDIRLLPGLIKRLHENVQEIMNGESDGSSEVDTANLAMMVWLLTQNKLNEIESDDEWPRDEFIAVPKRLIAPLAHLLEGL